MTETVANYLPAAFPRSSAGHVAIADGTIVSNWTAEYGSDCWDGISKEFATRRTLGGRDYWYGDGFGSPEAGFVYPMNSVVDRLTMNGVTVDMAATYGRPKGCCFLPWDLPDSGVIEGEQWFQLFPTPTATVPDRPGYYRWRVTLGQMVENPGWQGDWPKMRRCLLLEEVWWDSIAGWVRGGPVVAGATPWKKSANSDQAQAWREGTIQECPSVFHTTNFYAKDTGPLWIGTENGQAVHLANVEFGPLPPAQPTGATLDDVVAVLKEIRDELRAAPPPPPPPPEGPTGSTGPTGPTGPTGITVPPPPPPPPLPSGTLFYELPWASTTSATRLILPMSCENRLCIHFRTPPAPPSPYAVSGWIAMAEFGSLRCQRYGVISVSADAFDGDLGVGRYNAAFGPSLSWNFQVGAAMSYGMRLEPGTDYYLNVRNTDRYGNPSCTTGQDTTLFLDMMIPR